MSFDFAAALGGKFPGGLPPKLQPLPLGIVRDPFDIEESALTKAF